MEKEVVEEKVAEEEVVEEEVVEEKVAKDLLKGMQLLLSIKDAEEEVVEEKDVEELLKFMQEEGVMVEIPQGPRPSMETPFLPQVENSLRSYETLSMTQSKQQQ